MNDLPFINLNPTLSELVNNQKREAYNTKYAMMSELINNQKRMAYIPRSATPAKSKTTTASTSTTASTEAPTETQNIIPQIINSGSNYWSDIIYSTYNTSYDSTHSSTSLKEDKDYITYVNTKSEDPAGWANGQPIFNGDDLQANVNFTADDLYKMFSSVSGEQKLNDKETNNFEIGNTDSHGFLGSALNNKTIKFINDYDELNINWNYSNFFNDRDKWLKGIGDITSEPNWLYFKVFFDFNTTAGLFGGIVNEKTGNVRKVSATSALGFYLQWAGHYMAENAKGRMVALQKFVKTLNYISNYSPWFFQSIEGLDQLAIDLNTPLKDRTIKIKCLPDAIDMRLSTLFDFYKFACFDYINFKEILPANLRKFNMSIMFFSVPIRFIDTHSKIGSNEYKMRGTKTNDGLGAMCKILTFKNCEFVVDNMFNTPQSMKNETPFEFSTNTIGIKFQRSFETIINPYFNIKQSSFGLESINSDIPTRLRAIGGISSLFSNTTGSKSNGFLNTLTSALGFLNDSTTSKKISNSVKTAVNAALVDEAESFCQNLYETTQASWGSTPELGNIYDSEDSKLDEYQTPTKSNAVTSAIVVKGHTAWAKFWGGVKEGIVSAFKNITKKQNSSAIGWTNHTTIPKFVDEMAVKLHDNDIESDVLPKSIKGNNGKTKYPSQSKNSSSDNNSDTNRKNITFANNGAAWFLKASANRIPTIIQDNIKKTVKGENIKDWTKESNKTRYSYVENNAIHSTYVDPVYSSIREGKKVPDLITEYSKHVHAGKNITGITTYGAETKRHGVLVNPNESTEATINIRTVNGHKSFTVTTANIRTNKLIKENTTYVSEGVAGPICGTNNCSYVNDATNVEKLSESSTVIFKGSNGPWCGNEYCDDINPATDLDYLRGEALEIANGSWYPLTNKREGSYVNPVFGKLEEFTPGQNSSVEDSKDSAQDIANGQIKPESNYDNWSKEHQDTGFNTWTPTKNPVEETAKENTIEIAKGHDFKFNDNNVVDQVLQNTSDISKGQFNPVTDQTEDKLKENAVEITQGSFSFSAGYNPALDIAKETTKEISKGTINSGQSSQTILNNLKESVDKLLDSGNLNTSDDLLINTVKENSAEIATGQIKQDTNPIIKTIEDDSNLLAFGNFIPVGNTVIETAKENSEKISKGEIQPGSTLTVPKDTDQINTNTQTIKSGSATSDKTGNGQISINKNFNKM